MGIEKGSIKGLTQSVFSSAAVGAAGGSFSSSANLAAQRRGNLSAQRKRFSRGGQLGAIEEEAIRKAELGVDAEKSLQREAQQQRLALEDKRLTEQSEQFHRSLEVDRQQFRETEKRAEKEQKQNFLLGAVQTIVGVLT